MALQRAMLVVAALFAALACAQDQGLLVPEAQPLVPPTKASGSSGPPNPDSNGGAASRLWNQAMSSASRAQAVQPAPGVPRGDSGKSQTGPAQQAQTIPHAQVGDSSVQQHQDPSPHLRSKLENFEKLENFVHKMDTAAASASASSSTSAMSAPPPPLNAMDAIDGHHHSVEKNAVSADVAGWARGHGGAIPKGSGGFGNTNTWGSRAFKQGGNYNSSSEKRTPGLACAAHGSTEECCSRTFCRWCPVTKSCLDERSRDCPDPRRLGCTKDSESELRKWVEADMTSPLAQSTGILDEMESPIPVEHMVPEPVTRATDFPGAHIE